MPFVNNPPPDVRTWRPSQEDFNQATDRLMVKTLWNDTLVLAWSTDEASTGGLILARDAMPQNIREHFDTMLEPLEYEPGQIVQPELFVTQQDNGRLRFELAHPDYEGHFTTGGQVSHISVPLRRIMSSSHVSGTEGQIRSRSRLATRA